MNDDNHVDAGGSHVRLLASFGFDPANPTDVTSSINGVDPGYGAVKTNEITLGFEREVLPTFAVAVGGTYRKID